MARLVKAFGALVVVLAASAAWAQPGGGQGRGFFGGPGRPQSGVMLLAIDEVRTELATTSEQNSKIDELSDDLREQARDAFGDFQNQSDAQREEARRKLEEVGKQGDEKLAAILKPEQLDRLNQLKLQREGTTALARPEVADKLGLSQEQKDSVAKTIEAYRSQSSFPSNFRDLSDEERDKYFDEARQRREKVQAELLALLTDQQKTNWEAMQGEKFTFPERGRGR